MNLNSDSESEDRVEVEVAATLELHEGEDENEGKEEDEDDEGLGQTEAAAARLKAEAEGLTLLPSSNIKAGYRHVYDVGGSRPFGASVRRAGKQVAFIGLVVHKQFEGTARSPAHSETSRTPQATLCNRTFDLSHCGPHHARCAGHGILKGTVVEHYGSSGFRIEWEDGKSEDVTHKALVRRPRAYISFHLCLCTRGYSIYSLLQGHALRDRACVNLCEPHRRVHRRSC